MKLIIFFTLLFALIGCESFQRRDTYYKPSELNKKSPQAPGGLAKPKPMIKFEILEDRLGFHDYYSRYGIQEKFFNPCLYKQAFNYPVLCQDHYLTVVHLDIRCRESQGTVQQVYQSELSPLKNRRLEWSVGGQKGMSKTDFKGRTKIRVFSDRSIKYKRIRLQAGGQFLVMRLNQLKRIVVPPQWCG